MPNIVKHHLHVWGALRIPCIQALYAPSVKKFLTRVHSSKMSELEHFGMPNIPWCGVPRVTSVRMRGAGAGQSCATPRSRRPPWDTPTAW